MKVSIILPYFNAEKTISKTLQSIKNQTFQDYELIAINDQSTDDSLQCVKSFSFTNIKYLNTEDIHEKGIVSALNYGIKNSSGELICRIDSDDIMMPTRLEDQVLALEKFSDLNLIAADAIIIDENDKELGQLISTKNLSQLDERCCIIHPSVMWRKSYFDEQDLSYRKEYEFCEDYDLWLRFRQSKNPTYAKVPKALIKYRVSKSSISHTKEKEQRIKVKNLLKEHNIKPYLSVMNLTKKSAENFVLELEQQKFINYEIIESLDQAQGDYIAFSKFDNQITRFDVQINWLNNHKDYVGCGSFIQKSTGAFFYTPEFYLIEKELLRGHEVIESGTFMCRNAPDAFYYIDKKNPNFFELYCNLLKFGKLTNLNQPLVKSENYSVIQNKDLTERIKFARQHYQMNIINVVQLNITSDGNFSGVDRYLKTLEENMPANIRFTRVTFVAGNKIEWRLDNHNHKLIYYNPQKTRLESMYDMFFDNLKELFLDKQNLIVQSNCLNLYSLITYLRRKVKLIHVCAMHCVPYRETIRYDRKKFETLETLFEDDTKDFEETIEHILPITQADHVILNTLDAEHYYNRAGFLTKYSVIFNGIEKIGHYKNDYNNSRPFKFIVVGHSSPLKGIDQLLSIIEIVSKQHKIELHWAGSCEQQLKDIITKKNLPVISYGVISPDDLNRLYQNVDAALISTACETCSYAALEALSAELPTISTKAHGVTELIENVGLLVNINKNGIIDKNMYVEAMSQIILNKELRQQLSEKSAKKYEENYTKEKLLIKTLDLYKELVK